MTDRSRFRRVELAHVLKALAACVAILVATSFYRVVLHVSNPTTVALSFLLIVLLAASSATFWVAAIASVVAMLCFNYFFLPPIGTFTIADPHNWVALFAFLIVSLIASNLSRLARQRAEEAQADRRELTRLFDLGRDVLLTTESREAIPAVAASIVRRFDLEFAEIFLPAAAGWQRYRSGRSDIVVDDQALDTALEGAKAVLEFDAKARAYGGHRAVVTASGQTVDLVPLRVGTRPTGLLAIFGRRLEPGTADALAGLAAIAVERAQLLEERRTAEVERRSAELKSMLLASLGHDLKTPLTAIKVASSNLIASWLTDDQRREQIDIVLAEVERLNRLFQDILDMARIETHAVAPELQWVHPNEIVDAALAEVRNVARSHHIEFEATNTSEVRVDPRLTSAALVHLLENAGQYSPPGSPITVGVKVVDNALHLSVRDRGPGISTEDFPHLFEGFYRGVAVRDKSIGTGMGLPITQGLLAAEGGRVWAENCADGGALFQIVVPAETRPLPDLPEPR